MDTNNHGVADQCGRQVRDEVFERSGTRAGLRGGYSPAVNTWYHLMVVRPRGPNNGSITVRQWNRRSGGDGAYRGEDVPNDEITAPIRTIAR